MMYIFGSALMSWSQADANLKWQNNHNSYAYDNI